MNSFATFLHLLGNDLRRFRYFVVLFALINALAVVVERLALPGESGNILFSILRMVQMVGFPLLAIQVFLADSAADTRSDWWARPIRPGTLLAAKLGYLLVALWLPALVLYLGGWIYDGMTARQLVLAALELTVYTVGVSVFFGGIAAASTSFWVVLAWGGVLVAGGIVSGWLANALDLRAAGSWWSVSESVQPLFVFLAFLLAGILCFTGVFFLRRKRPFYFGLVLVATLSMWMPRGTYRFLTGARSHPEIILASPDKDESREGTLLKNIALRGMSGNAFAVPVTCDFSFTDSASRVARFELGVNPWNFVSRFDHRIYAWPVLRGSFSEEMRARPNGQSGQSFRDHLSSQARIRADVSLDVELPGRLAGDIDYLLYEVIDAGMMPLEKGTRVKHEGHSLRLTKVEEGERRNGIEVTIRTTRPTLRLFSHLDERTTRYQQAMSVWILALVFPGSGEAELTVVNPRIMQGPFPITSHGRETFDFSPPGDYDAEMGPPSLHVFRLVATGVYHQSFDWSGHLAETDLRSRFDRGVLPAASGSVEASVALANLKTVDDLFNYRSPASTSGNANELNERAREIFIADIPGSLARAPWDGRFFWPMKESVEQYMTEDEIPELRKALERDPRLIGIVAQRKWGDRFHEYVTRQLARRVPVTEPAVAWLAAEYRDPALYGDLRWHFLHGSSGRDTLYGLLDSLPDFDARSVLEDAWERGRLTGARRDLWVLALDHGLPGAMDHAVRQLYLEGIGDSERNSRLLRNLRRVTHHTGPWKEFYPWIEKHAANLVYDADAMAWRLPE